MRSFLSTVFNWKIAYIPVHSGLLTLKTAEDRYMAYRDWYVFGLRICRYQFIPQVMS